jgi:hypothetical protein
MLGLSNAVFPDEFGWGKYGVTSICARISWLLVFDVPSVD